MISTVRCTAPAKVILFGEHFVVGGKRAVVTAIDRRAEVKCSPRSRGILVRSGGGWVLSEGGRTVGFSDHSAVKSLRPYLVVASEIIGETGGENGAEIEIMSEIPRGAGLGSSAAVAVAAAKALTTMFGMDSSVEEVVRYGMISEKIVHGRPSGIDVHIAALGGTLLYRGVKDWQRLDNVTPEVIVVDSGGRRATGRLVQNVQAFAKNNPDIFEDLSQLYDELLQESLRALKEENSREIGRCMNANQVLLRILGVSSNTIERAVTSVLSKGAYGAKLTGAGGNGCVIAVGEKEFMMRALKQVVEEFPGSWLARTSAEGVRVESH